MEEGLVWGQKVLIPHLLLGTADQAKKEGEKEESLSKKEVLSLGGGRESAPYKNAIAVAMNMRHAQMRERKKNLRWNTAFFPELTLEKGKKDVTHVAGGNREEGRIALISRKVHALLPSLYLSRKEGRYLARD